MSHWWGAIIGSPAPLWITKPVIDSYVIGLGVLLIFLWGVGMWLTREKPKHKRGALEGSHEAKEPEELKPMPGFRPQALLGNSGGGKIGKAIFSNILMGEGNSLIDNKGGEIDELNVDRVASTPTPKPSEKGKSGE